MSIAALILKKIVWVFVEDMLKEMKTEGAQYPIIVRIHIPMMKLVIAGNQEI